MRRWRNSDSGGHPSSGCGALIFQKLGGVLLGFNVDPEFSDALDGLILVDLKKTEPKLLKRYLPEVGTRKESHVTLKSILDN